ncbi:RteC domain-containing protein [Galbibacter sp. EGI 63066]|uniref:RteC domain-containing protein n=1 Tax=Galbibacter sp. EGI 63066 TaxID=2993559 RepID=UPI0022497B71|nr:RteC domain-containing protein [Galbibacter sp. EGI 63066]MCX2681936.1 RteC domain-containing protein [Galbibacter sp. EGI 63066]
MDRKYKDVIDRFNEKLTKIKADKRISLKRTNEGIHLCNNTLYLLKGIVEKHGFEDITAEIHFFKKVKAEPLGFLVYFSEVRSCELLMPKVGINNQLSFLKKKIRRINKFFNRNWDFVHYMEQGLTYLDNQYFTRENQVFPLYALPEACYLDPKFFTSKDMLWARIKGMNHYIAYVKNLIQEIQPQNKCSHQEHRYTKPLQWTSSKAALTELIYALYVTRAINDGKEDIKTIASCFEVVFGVKLENLYKTYFEIKARKGSRTRFLEELVQRFNEKMDRDDEFLDL